MPPVFAFDDRPMRLQSGKRRSAGWKSFGKSDRIQIDAARAADENSGSCRFSSNPCASRFRMSHSFRGLYACLTALAAGGCLLGLVCAVRSDDQPPKAEKDRAAAQSDSQTAKLSAEF